MKGQRMNKARTKECQNQIQYDAYTSKGSVRMGPWTSHIWRSDPRHLGFLLARYKFCSKMLAGKSRVLEVGCGDGAGIPVMLQSVGSVHGIDFEPLVIRDARKRLKEDGFSRFDFSILDMAKTPLKKGFDAAYSLDVIEHIPPSLERRFMKNVCLSLKPHGLCIIGTPNVDASKYASKASAEGHVNLKSADSLKALLSVFFHHVLIFSMNDEVVHTGFYPMAHYLLGIGLEPK